MAVYIRCQKPESNAFSNLLVAKSKVDPLQTICLPRLELSGAVLLANLVHYVITSLKFSESEVILWTDSSIVLGWLSKPPSTWETWRHVPTHENPADLGTRGCRPQDLNINPLWWYGPRWLLNYPSEWPSRNPLNPPITQHSIQALHTSTQKIDLLDRFSSYQKALRVLCYVYRFCNRSLAKIRPHNQQPGQDLSQE